MPAPNKLSEKERKSVVGFLNGLSKKDACMEAGYAPSVKAHEVFKRPSVMKEIERRQHSMSTKAGVTADWIVERLKLIAGADLTDMLVIYEDGTGVPDLNKLTPGLRVALTGIETDKFGDVVKIKVKLSDKLKALEMLARHLGMFNDKLEIAGELSLEDRLMAGRNRIDGEACTKETD